MLTLIISTLANLYLCKISVLLFLPQCLEIFWLLLFILHTLKLFYLLFCPLKTLQKNEYQVLALSLLKNWFDYKFRFSGLRFTCLPTFYYCYMICYMLYIVIYVAIYKMHIFKNVMHLLSTFCLLFGLKVDKTCAKSIILTVISPKS